jgi:feruloyl esterase
MNLHLERAIQAVCGLLLSLGPLATPGTLAAVECTQSSIQAISPTNTTIVSATPQSDPVAYCDVLGYVTTLHPGPNQVNFELSLPAEGNGRFLFIGNGGFGGGLGFPEVFPDFESIPDLTKAGFAITFTDTGHQGTFLDGSWALDDQAKQDDFLFRGVHATAVAAKTITNRFYGRRLHSYFAGCSDGGREGVIEAERYPLDFDGIIAGDPALGPVIPAFNWNQEHLTTNADSYIPPDKLALVDAAVMNSCDAADGVADGLIQDPRRCKFDPASLVCSPTNSPSCLTRAQVAGLTAVYAGAITGEGRNIYPGLSKSDPAKDDSWGTWITGLVPPDELGSAEPWSDPTLAPWQFLFQDQVLKFFVFADPGYNSLSFNLNSSDLTKTQMVMNRGGGEGTNPDLFAFQDRGGKLIIYHGWSDPAFSPLETIRYYNAVIQDQGGLNRTGQFVRLFMAPGMQHCIGSGPGPNVFDPLTSLIDWVERNVEPKKITAVHFQDNDPSTGVVTRTMPLCPYPKTAIFNGGDVNQASNWSCHRAEE